MIKIDFNLPLEENIAYLLAKKPKISFNFDELKFQAHQRAFSVAKMMQIDLLADIQASLIKAQAKGEGFEQWQAGIVPRLQKQGWWGEKQITNPKTGEIKNIVIGSSRLKTIFETNMASAYAKGKKQAQFDPDNDAVYLRYVSLLYGNRRENHKVLHGIIKHRDDPFWKENYPPNGYNCQCRVFAYTREQLEQRGWSEHQGELPDIADKSFRGNILENQDKELDKIYLEKAKRIIGINEPSKLLKSLIFSDYQSILENRRRWKEIKGLYEDPSKDRSIVIAQTSDILSSFLQTQSKNILLSAYTIRKQKNKHPELGAFDYYLIAHMGNKPLYKFKDRDYSVVFVEKLGGRYRIVYKVTRDRNEIYVTSLVKYSRDDKDFEAQIRKLKSSKEEIDG
ncbi:hypothetical protein BKH41_02750 [Helicobacter sp. 12S02232-10]|uniref:phage head morphogenesis protein n=1 Tax=Helicobacter sp. 12S02232-10 TaxID=1476197 RepID=UPI000BA5F343|nr:phage minor head protein [Helicobacter sp. 12S02232-10]PAF49601.1 hypothetical protein BKH41_02750 [Helicobacter sp. 12S02232-10]